MHGNMIDLNKIHRINRLSKSTVVDIIEGAPTETLRDLRINQFHTAAERLKRDIDLFLERVENAQNIAAEAQVTLLIECTGIQADTDPSQN